MNFQISEDGILAALPVVIGGILLAAQAWFARRFAPLGQLASLSRRVDVLEKNAHAPNADAIQEIERRISTVEVSVGELRGDIRGVRDGIGRVEHMVELLVQAGLQKTETRDAR